jgi:D-alanyl-D-alanine carboxypeptidase
MKKLKAILVIFLILLCLGIVAFVFWQRHEYGRWLPTEKSNTPTSTSQKKTTTSDGFNKSQYSLTDASSLWVIANKPHPLHPVTYTPANLVVPNIPLRNNITDTEKYVRSDTATALEKMVADAKTQGINLNLQSGYRSYQFQVNLYNLYVKQQGQAEADRESARPGTSEHQTGLAADLGGTSNPSCNVAQCFANTVEGKWLAANAYKYGFIIRYPANKETVTGYEYEPWHIRYIGTDLSNEMHKQGVETLEEFFGVSGGTQYN